MDTNLRPLTLGEILDRTAQLYRENFALFAGIAAVLAGAVLAINVVSLAITHALHLTPYAMLQSWWYQVAGWLSFAAMMVLSEVATAANNRAVAWVYLGERASIVTAYRSILAKFKRYVWIGMVKLGIAWSPVLLLYAAFQVTYIYFQHSGVLPRPGEVPTPGTQPGAGMLYFGLAVIGFGILIWPALIYAFFMALRYALALPASVVEGLTTRQSLKRSIALSKGARGRIFVLWLLVIVVAMIAGAVTQTFFIVYSMKHHLDVPLWLQMVQQFISFLSNTFVAPILAIGTCLFYFDQRVRKEGFDIEWMMQAAGMTPGALPESADATLIS